MKNIICPKCKKEFKPEEIFLKEDIDKDGVTESFMCDCGCAFKVETELSTKVTRISLKEHRSIQGVEDFELRKKVLF